MFTAAPSSTVPFLLLQGYAHGLTAELCFGDTGLAIPCVPAHLQVFQFWSPEPFFLTRSKALN